MHIAEHEHLIIGYQTSRFRVVHALPDPLVVRGTPNGSELVISRKALTANNMDVGVVPDTPWYSWFSRKSNKTE